MNSVRNNYSLLLINLSLYTNEGYSQAETGNSYGKEQLVTKENDV